MATVMYPCGCWFSHSMFGHRELTGFSICTEHCIHPDVQHAEIGTLQQVISALQPIKESEL